MSASLFVLALLPIVGAVLPAAARRRRRLAYASAAAVLAAMLALGAALWLATPADGATLLGWPWVGSLDLTLALRFDRLGGATVVVIALAGLVALWGGRRRAAEVPAGDTAPALIVLFAGLAQAAVLAENALLLVACALLAALAAFALETGAGPAGGRARIALYARIAGALALLAGFLLLADATGSFEFATLLRLGPAVRAEPLHPLLVALLYAGAWSRTGPWPWSGAWRRRPAAAGHAASLTGAVLLATGASLAIRLWPVLGDAPPRALVALGFIATPLAVAAIDGGVRALGWPDEPDAPAPADPRGGARG